MPARSFAHPARALALTVALATAAALLLIGPLESGADDAPDIPPEIVILARSDNPADALGAGPVAGILGAPVLVTLGSRLVPAAADALEAFDPELVILAGGEGALSAQVEADVAALGYDTERAAGADRHETAALLAGLLAEHETGRPLLSGAPVTDAIIPGLNAERLGGLTLAELLAQLEGDFLGADDTAVDSEALQGHGPEDFVPAGHDQHVQQATHSSADLAEDHEPRASAELTLDDPCGDGDTLWNVRASVSGQFLTSHDPDTLAVVGLSVDNDSEVTLGNSVNQTVRGDGQIRENFALERMFTVAPGERTVYALARVAHTDPWVRLANTRLIVSTMGYTCS